MRSLSICGDRTYSSRELTECFTVVRFSQANDSDNFPGEFIGASSKFPLDIPRYIVYKIKRYKIWTIIYFSCKRIFMKYILCSNLFISSGFLPWVCWTCLQYGKCSQVAFCIEKCNWHGRAVSIQTTFNLLVYYIPYITDCQMYTVFSLQPYSSSISQWVLSV